MLAVILGRAAVDAGFRVYCTTAADLAARCRKAALAGRWANTMNFFSGPRLLIIDELGYLPMPAEDAATLFQVISRRYRKVSVILTTNRNVEFPRFGGHVPSRYHLQITREIQIGKDKTSVPGRVPGRSGAPGQVQRPRAHPDRP